MRNKEPSLRITRWLRVAKMPGTDVPLEGECTACADARFTLNHDVRESFHRPDHDVYLAKLQAQFDAHVKAVHPLDDVASETE